MESEYSHIHRLVGIIPAAGRSLRIDEAIKELLSFPLGNRGTRSMIFQALSQMQHDGAPFTVVVTSPVKVSAHRRALPSAKACFDRHQEPGGLGMGRYRGRTTSEASPNWLASLHTNRFRPYSVG